jgi:hypothetical protein
MMDKDVFAALAGDEAVALAAVEPLDGTLNTIGHVVCLLGKKMVVACSWEVLVMEPKRPEYLQLRPRSCDFQSELAGYLARKSNTS